MLDVLYINFENLSLINIDKNFIFIVNFIFII